MDTIHTLNTSLPSSDPRLHDPPRSSHPTRPHNTDYASNSNNSNSQNQTSRPKTPPPNLHAAFKAAAYSVAQLYKTAATDSVSARTEGYQDAIDELLTFLDRENLGLGDGEGWRVRQWATERLEPSIYNAVTNDADGDYMKDNQQAPKAESSEHNRIQESTRETTNQQPSEGNQTSTSDADTTTKVPASAPDKSDIFRFTAGPQANDTDMTHDDAPSSRSPTSLRVNLRPNRSRSSFQHHQHAASIPLGTLGIGGGAKRKSPPCYPETFDLGAFGFGSMSNIGGVGGKRSRME